MYLCYVPLLGFCWKPGSASLSSPGGDVVQRSVFARGARLASAMAARVLSSRSAPKKQPVVIDLGSAFIRCGFAGDPRPIHVVPSPLGGNNDTSSKSSFPSERATANAGGASGGPRPARTREEWVEVLTGAFSRLYTESLQCRPKERKVVICESMVSPRPLREAVAHVLFRFLQVPSLHLSAGPAPALFCTGLDTGMVLDIGQSEAHVVAVYRGANLTSAYTGAPLGCRAVQERIGELLAEEEDRRHRSQHEAAAKEGDGGGGGGGGRMRQERPLTSRELEDVMVRSCLVPVGGVPSADQVSPMEFMFAGRRRVVASGGLRTVAVEQALFEGDEEGRSLATLVLDCLGRCPRDCRRALAQNVVVAGGGGLLPGLCARLAEEIKALTGAGGALGQEDPERYAWARAVVSGSRCQGDQAAAAAAAGDGERGASTGGDAGGAGAGAGAGGGAGAQEGEGLCVVAVPVRRDQLVWTGASIMASLGGIADSSLTSEKYLAAGARGRGEAGRLPDWMSVSAEDWLFEAGAGGAAAAPVSAV